MEWPIVSQWDRLDTQVTTSDTIKADLDIATYVRRSKVANAFEVKVPVTSNWNLKLLSNLVTSIEDREVVTFLRYGWPLSHNDTSPVIITKRNQASVEKYSTYVERYIS